MNFMVTLSNYYYYYYFEKEDLHHIKLKDGQIDRGGTSSLHILHFLGKWFRKQK